MFNLHNVIYNIFWYYTLVTETCSGVIMEIRNRCGCSKQITDTTLEDTSDIIFKKHSDILNSVTYYTFVDKGMPLPTKQYDVCDYEFLEITLTLLNNHTYNIYINKDEYNFYCVGNKLNHTFFEWYLKTFYNLKSLEKNTYSVSLIDKDIVEHMLTSNHTVVLNKENFIII